MSQEMWEHQGIGKNKEMDMPLEPSEGTQSSFRAMKSKEKYIMHIFLFVLFLVLFVFVSM